MSDATRLDLIFSALGDATRRDILSRLVERDLSVSEIAENYAMSLPAVAKHVSILERAGLLILNRQGRNKIASLQFDAFGATQIWLGTISDDAAIWDELETRLENYEGV